MPTFLRGSCRRTNNNNLILIRFLSLFFQSPLESLRVGGGDGRTGSRTSLLAHLCQTAVQPRASSYRDRLYCIYTGGEKKLWVFLVVCKNRDTCKMEVQGKKSGGEGGYEKGGPNLRNYPSLVLIGQLCGVPFTKT